MQGVLIMKKFSCSYSSLSCAILLLPMTAVITAFCGDKNGLTTDALLAPQALMQQVMLLQIKAQFINLKLSHLRRVSDNFFFIFEKGIASCFQGLLYFKKGKFLLKNCFFKSTRLPLPPESPQNGNFLPCLFPPSVLSLETCDLLFCLVFNLRLYNSTIHLYQSGIPKR